MRTLHLFGDSFTEGHNLDLTFPPYKEWRKYRGGELPPCWGDLLSEKLNMTLANRAMGGMSNDEIFNTICRYSDQFQKDDIVIINWTYPHRFQWAFWSEEKERYTWIRLGADPRDGSVISESTRTEIALNRILSPYIDRIYEYEHFICEYSKSKKFQVYFWSADIDIINDLPSSRMNNRKYILHKQIDKLPPKILTDGKHIHIHRTEMKRTIFDVFYEFGGCTIAEETNFEVGDNHLGERGHFVQYELFYKYLTENNLI